MRRFVLFIAGLCAALGLAAAQSFAPANANVGVLGTGISPSRETTIDSETDCLEALPDGMSVAGVTDEGGTVTLDVLVLLDGVSAARGQELFSIAQKSYTPLQITLRPTFQVASFQGVEAMDLIGQARAFVGGQRPAGTDLVHVLTNKDIADSDNTAVAGMADCIGGVKDGTHAFSVGESTLVDELRFGPVGVGVEMAARVTAHEMGHLLGAHHHYANCVEGTLNATSSVEAATCTLMINVVDLSVTNFSTLNGTIVRAHAVDYARP